MYFWGDSSVRQDARWFLRRSGCGVFVRDIIVIYLSIFFLLRDKIDCVRQQRVGERSLLNYFNEVPNVALHAACKSWKKYKKKHKSSRSPAVPSVTSSLAFFPRHRALESQTRKKESKVASIRPPPKLISVIEILSEATMSSDYGRLGTFFIPP